MKRTDLAGFAMILLTVGAAVWASPAQTAESVKISGPSPLLQPAVTEAPGQCRQQVGPFRSEADAGSARENAARAGYHASAVISADRAAGSALPRYFFAVAYPC